MEKNNNEVRQELLEDLQSKIEFEDKRIKTLQQEVDMMTKKIEEYRLQ